MAVKKVPATVSNSPGQLVLQWLTYAFWGWTVLSLVWLTAQSVSYYLNSSSGDVESMGEAIAYSLAAVIVLFVISLICDFVYSKREPTEKRGAAMVIMIIHAVIFGLLGIAALIAAVFAVVSLLIGTGQEGDTGAQTTLITGLVIAVVYGATLLRTLKPTQLPKINVMYWGFMALMAGVMVALSIAGPTLHAQQTKQDRVIERGLGDISSSIRGYANLNAKLPATLEDVKKYNNANGKELIEEGLVEYKPGKQLTADDASRPLQRPTSVRDAFEYTLCVTYKAKKGDSSYSDTSSYREYSPNTYTHDAGRVCYDLVTRHAY